MKTSVTLVPVESTRRRTDEIRGFFAVLFGASVLGLSAIFVRWAVAGGATPISVGFYRMLFAVPAAYWLARRSGSAGGGVGRRWAGLAGAAFSLDLWMWHVAMNHTTAANATLLVGLAPVWVALFSIWALRLRYDWVAWLGQAVGLGGALVLALAKGARGGTGKGELIAIGASFSYAAFTLSLKKSRRTLGAEQSLFWMSVTCLLCFAVALMLTGGPGRGYDGRAWLSLLGLGLIVQIVGWWCNSWGIGHTDAALAAIALQGQQVATLGFAAWLLSEPLKPLGLVGGALIISGIVMVARNPGGPPRGRQELVLSNEPPPASG